MSERRGLLDQKVEIEKTLGLMVHPVVNSVVRKRDSMDMSLLEDHGHRHRDRAMSGDYASSNNYASHYSSSSCQKNSMSMSSKGEATDSLKTFKTHNTSASSGFSATTAPTSGSHPGGRRGSILGQVFRGSHATAWANSRAAANNNDCDDGSQGSFFDKVAGDGFHDNTNVSDDDDDDDDDDSFVGILGSRNDTLRASDHLFLSDEIFTSPSLRCLSITSRESLKLLKNIKVVCDDDNDEDANGYNPTTDKNDANGCDTDKAIMGGHLMTYDEYKAATTTSTDNPTPNELNALSKINQRRRRATMSFDTDTTHSTKSIEGEASDAFVPPSKDAMEAFARINLRKARRATMAHGTTPTSGNTGNSNIYDPKPPNMKPGHGQPSSNAPIRQSTTTRKAHVRRPSIWGGLLNTLSAEVVPLPSQAGSHPSNRRSSDGPCTIHHRAPDLRNKKGRVYSM